MPFCPKCWQEYPKGFVKCNACNLDLTEERPQGSKHEHPHEQTPSKPGTSPKTKK
jgi:hypothetical protein